jgi:group I intron endonuclease
MAACDFTARYGCVYLITNTVNGKKYVGQTVQPLDTRWRQHQKQSQNKAILQLAIRKHGAAAFTVSMLAEAGSREELNALERRFIEQLGTLAPAGYNLYTGGGAAGKLAESLRQRIKEAAQRPEVKARFSAGQRRRFERQEERAKVAADTKARSAAPEYRKAMADRSRSVMARPGVRERLSEASRLLWQDPEYLARMALAKSTDDHKARKGAAISAAHARPESKAKRSEKSKATWQDPAYRAKQEAMHADPEWQARRGAAIREGKARAKAKRAAADT